VYGLNEEEPEKNSKFIVFKDKISKEFAKIYNFCCVSFQNFCLIDSTDLKKLPLDVLMAFIKENAFQDFHSNFIEEVLIKGLDNPILKGKHIEALIELFSVDSIFSEQQICEFFNKIMRKLTPNRKIEIVFEYVKKNKTYNKFKIKYL